MELVTHNFVGETRGATAFVKRDVCVVIGKVKVRLDVTCGLGSKVEVQILFRFEEVTALEVVTGNVSV